VNHHTINFASRAPNRRWADKPMLDAPQRLTALRGMTKARTGDFEKSI